ncbi:baseplate protein J-like protein [Vibrio phage 1.161.O._10N.261.48.C5]|nr:baseplate protein J-like protein [Vibrio phage 1.161.O._10N.261.48.C5]
MPNITPQGWESQSVESIVEELIARAEADYGTSFPTTPDSFAGQFFNIMAAQEKKIQDLGQAITSTQNLSSAEGIYLDYIAEHKNTRRFRSSGSYGLLSIKGSQGKVIPVDTPFKDVTSRVVLTTDSITLNRAACYSCDISLAEVLDNTEYLVIVEGVSYSYTTGTSTTEEDILQGLQSALSSGSSTFTVILEASTLVISNISLSNSLTFTISPSLTIKNVGGLVNAEAVTLGSATYLANSITEIVINSLDIVSVSNPKDFTSGRFEETDPELRARLEDISDQAGVATIPAMQAALTNVSGVTNVLILDNKTDFTNANGIPPRSFEAYVVGGEEQEVGEKLYEVQPAGISTHGDITVLFDDINGDPQSASFSRKGSKIAWVRVDYSLNEEEDFPSDGEQALIDAIISYGNSMYSGEDLIANKFMVPCYTVGGVEINTIEVAITDSLVDTPSYQTGRIPVSVVTSLIFSEDSIVINNT